MANFAMPGLSITTFTPTSSANAAAEWTKWLSRFDTYLEAIGIESPGRKRALLLTCAGEEIHEIFSTLPEPAILDGAPPLDAYETAKKKLNTRFQSQTNVEIELFHFRNERPVEGEQVEKFYNRLCKLAASCDFHDTNREIKSQLILHTTPRLRRYALRNATATLSDLLSEARLQETAEQRATLIEERAPQEAFERTHERRGRGIAKIRTTIVRAHISNRPATNVMKP
jgi:hypothetical protein